MNSQNDPNKSRSKYVSNLTLAAVAGLVGLLTLVIILVAVFGGLWLDNHFGTRPRYTLILVIVSMPVTLILMFVIVRSITKKIEKNLPTNTSTVKEFQQEKEEDWFE